MDPEFQTRFRLYGAGQPLQPQSALARIAGAIAGVVVFVLALIAGGVLLLVFLALAAAVAMTLGIRVWWWKRQLQRQMADHGDPDLRPRADDRDHDTIEGEYRVIDD